MAKDLSNKDLAEQLLKISNEIYNKAVNEQSVKLATSVNIPTTNLTFNDLSVGDKLYVIKISEGVLTPIPVKLINKNIGIDSTVLSIQSISDNNERINISFAYQEDDERLTIVQYMDTYVISPNIIDLHEYLTKPLLKFL